MEATNRYAAGCILLHMIYFDKIDHPLNLIEVKKIEHSTQHQNACQHVNSLGLVMTTRLAVADRVQNSKHRGKVEQQQCRETRLQAHQFLPRRVRPKRPLAFQHRSLFVSALGDSRDIIILSTIPTRPISINRVKFHKTPY